MMRADVRCVVAAALVCVGAWTSVALGSVAGPPDALQPKSYESCSGQFRVHVDPSNPQGAGRSTVAFSENGKPLWKLPYDFTLWDATVLDDGSTIGYAYSWGAHGWGYSVGDLPKNNVLWLVRIDRDGKVVTRDEFERKDDQSFICAPIYVPRVESMVVVPDMDRVVYRLSRGMRDKSEGWILYSLTTGERVGGVNVEAPDDTGSSRVWWVTPVPGCSDVLIARDVFQYANNESVDDLRLSIVGLDGREVWSRTYPGELGSRVDHGARRIRFDGDTLVVQLATTGRSTRYAWRLGADGGIAGDLVAVGSGMAFPRPVAGTAPAAPEEARRAPDPVVLDSPAPVVAELDLSSGPGSPIDAIYDFSVDDRGRIGWVRNDGVGNRLVVIDRSGVVATDRVIDIGDAKRRVNVVWSSGDRWLAYDSGIGGKAGAWWVDASTGVVSAIPEFTSGGMRAVAAMPDGGFVGLVGKDWVMARDLAAFDAAGRERWRVTDYDISPEDLTVTTEGEIVVLDNIRRRLVCYDGDGHPAQTIALDEVCGRKLNYPSGVERDVDGGVVVHDFNGMPPVYRIDREGKEIARCTPVFADGRSVSLAGHVQVDPDGVMWTSDGHSFLRLGEDGTATMVLGDAPEARPLQRIAGFTVGPDGRIYAVNEASASLHAFDADGRPIGVCQPDPGDFGGRVGFASVGVGPDGTVYYNAGGGFYDAGHSGYLRVTRELHRVGWTPFRMRDVSESWRFQPNGDRMWGVGYETMALFGSTGEIEKTIDRRPGGDWLGQPDDAAVASDGSIAVVTRPLSPGITGTRAVCVYSADGEPVREFPLPSSMMMVHMAYAPPYVVLVVPHGVFLVDEREESPTPRAIVAQEEGREYWDACAAPDGRSVYLRRAGDASLTRIALPER